MQKKEIFLQFIQSQPTGRFLKINIFIKPISVKENGKTINLIKKIQGVNKVMPERKETKLLTDFQQGSKKAFEKIYNLYWKGLYLHAYKRLNAEDLAEELVQELFIQLWEKRKEIKVEKSLQHYLYGVIKKKILHHLRGAVPGGRPPPGHQGNCRDRKQPPGNTASNSATCYKTSRD